ncbi:MAG: hypothetical protein M0R46_06430 [Candidatus Muirbacterium halophilum]|nr:hypothetical protein [Candidatus Muirbacterium halophilum]
MIKYEQVLKFIEGLPGIYSVSTNLHNSIKYLKTNHNQVFFIFNVEEKNMEGLFYLSRCICNRYSSLKDWNITIDIGDKINSNGDRPIHYILGRNINNYNDYNILSILLNKELNNLYINLSDLYYNKNFMNYYNMNSDKYKEIKEVEFNRRLKLDSLLNDQQNEKDATS